MWSSRVASPFWRAFDAVTTPHYPVSFTDAAFEEDPFLAISAGRAFFRAADLLRLAELISGLGR